MRAVEREAGPGRPARLWAVAPLLCLLWLDVPFVKQEKNGCGAAVIAMVMRYWDGNSDVDAGKIRDNLVAGEMARYFRDRGFRAFMFRGQWADLENHLAMGRPLIVALKDGRSHYVVVAGLDQERDLVLLNDPARKKLSKMRRTDFAERWEAMGNWTLLAVPQQAR